MRRMHFFYLTVLLSLLLVGGYRRCQWSGISAESVYPGAMLALERGHQSVLWEIQQGFKDYPSAQGAFYTRRAVALDSLLHLFDNPVSKDAGKEEAIWRDSIQVLLHEDKAMTRQWLALDTLSVRTPTWSRVKNYLLQERADQLLTSKIQGSSTNCWFGFQLGFYPAENLLRLGDTLHAEVGELRLSHYPEKIWINGQPLVGSGVDSVFNTPGWYVLDLRVVTSLPYRLQNEARRRLRFYVLNHSK